MGFPPATEGEREPEGQSEAQKIPAFIDRQRRGGRKKNYEMTENIGFISAIRCQVLACVR